MSRSSQRAEQEIKVTGDLHRLNVDYARNSAYMKAHRLLVGDLLRALRTSKFLRAVFDEGVQRYERLVSEKRAGDEARIHTALSDVGGALESWIKDEHRVLLHIFYEDVGVADRRLSMVETFCATSRSIARRGEPEDAQQVLHQWEKAKVQADHMWTPYRNEERRIERNLQDMDQAFMDLETIRLTSYREYSKQDVLNVVACSLVFERVARGATELSAQTGGIAAVMQTGEAGKKIEDIMRELETYNTELEKRQKAKYEKQQKLAVDRLRAQIDGTHIKYKVDIEIERLKGAKFSDDVCVREGQSPKFCGARTEIVPPQSGNTQRMKWMPPALEAKLQATSDPLVSIRHSHAGQALIHRRSYLVSSRLAETVPE